MAAPVLNCKSCESRVSVFDQYCGVCGVALAALRWSLPDEEGWHSGDGYVAVQSSAISAGVSFYNDGVVPAGLVLRTADLASLPDWVDRRNLDESLGREPLILEGGDERTIEVPLLPERLAHLFASEEGVRPGSGKREARLPFLTNLHEWRDGLWTSRPFQLTLLLARPPRIVPAASFYRFLPVELLAGDGLPHEIEIFNETTRDVELAPGVINDDRASTPPGYEFVPANAILHGVPLELPAIEASSSWKGSLRLVDPGLSGEQLGWFAFDLEYPIQTPRETLERSQEPPPPLRCRVEGRLGRGPTLKVQGEPRLWIPLDRIGQAHAFTLRNPGQIPLVIKDIEIWRNKNGVAGQVLERDWLSLSGLSSGDRLGPGEARALLVELHPSQRPSDEFQEELCQRTVRVLHDGLEGPNGRQLELQVLVTFGAAEEVLAGIDFGTTNSVVCVGGLDGSYPLPLEFSSQGWQDRIRSLMYFDSQGLKGAAEPFFFGEEAYSSAAIRPENLVRSIKSVVARDPGTYYVFYQRIAGQGELPVTKTPYELLDLFISELRERSENGVSHLPAEAFNALGVNLGTQLTFSRAVFSHPAEMPKEARRALMRAAHQAGINEATTDVDEFFEQHCIDEATAAVLAYCAERIKGRAVLGSELSDCERIVSFDMGGGTTDLAAVEILNMKEHLADKEEEEGTPVIVKLKDKAGSPFGGDDLDRTLAVRILSEIRRKSELEGAPVIIDEIHRALEAKSYSDFHIDYQRRHREWSSEMAKQPVEDLVPGLYKLAEMVLIEAERMKCALAASSLESVTSSPLTGTGWPREKGDAQAEANNFEIQILRRDFEEMVLGMLKDRLPLLDEVVQGAGWEWPSVTTLLFTGQSTLIQVIRKAVALYVSQRRGEDAPPLLQIDPGQGGFDPKNCVAVGAVLWGTSRNEGSWLEIQDGTRGGLTFDVKTKMGVKLRAVKGLRKGNPFPVPGTVKVRRGSTELKLYREGKQDPYVRFRFPPARQDGEITVWVRGLADYSAVVDGQEIKGEMLS